MILVYSVWNPSEAAYDYFAAPGKQSSASAQPHHLRGQKRNALGVAPEAAAWPLPSGARHIGRGKIARGIVATTPTARALGEMEGGGSLINIGGAAIIGYLVAGPMGGLIGAAAGAVLG